MYLYIYVLYIYIYTCDITLASPLHKHSITIGSSLKETVAQFGSLPTSSHSFPNSLVDPATDSHRRLVALREFQQLDWFGETQHRKFHGFYLVVHPT